MTSAFLHNKQGPYELLFTYFRFLCVQACLKLFYMFSSLFEYVCYIIFWIFWDPPRCSSFFTFYPWLILSRDPWVTFWICSGFGERIWEEIPQYFSWHLLLKIEKNSRKQNTLSNLSCVPPVSYLSILDDRSLLKNMSRGRSDQTPCHQTRAPISHLTHFTHPERETEIFHKIFQKYSFCVSQAVTHVSNSEFCKNIYKHLTRQNWLTNWYQHSTTLHSRQT